MNERINTLVRNLMDERERAANKKKEYDDAVEDRDLAESILFEALEDIGLKSITTDFLGPDYGKVRVVRRETDHSRVLDQDALLDWANREGRTEEVFDTKVRKKVLNQAIRSARELKMPIPDGLDFYTDRGITLTRLNKKPKQ